MLRLGDRALFVGQTGRGKTVAMSLLLDRLYGQRQMIVLNTKDDPIYASWGGLRVSKLAELRKARWPENPLAIYSPERTERRNPAFMDAFCSWIWERRHTIVAIDELRQVAPGAIPLPGFADLVERSRGPRDITVAMGTQRCSFIPHSAYSESSVFYVFGLSDRRDRATIAGFTHEDLIIKPPHKYGFWEYRAGDMEAHYWRDVRELLEAGEASRSTGQPHPITKPSSSQSPSSGG